MPPAPAPCCAAFGGLGLLSMGVLCVRLSLPTVVLCVRLSLPTVVLCFRPPQTEEVMFVEEPEEEVEEVEEEKKKKKKLRRRVNRDLVPKPFDTVITTTERWEKERENRIKMATERKARPCPLLQTLPGFAMRLQAATLHSLDQVLLAVTAVFTEKIIADATDDATGGEREPMKSYVHES